MDRIEFYRRQATRFATLATECTDPEVSAKLMAIATEYREMLNGSSQRRLSSNRGSTTDICMQKSACSR